MKDANRRFGLPWTDDDRAKLLQLRADGNPWKDIALELGRPVLSCRTIHGNLVRASTPLAERKRRWTEAEVAEMIRLREVEHKPWSQIDALLQRPDGGSAQKYEGLRLPKKPVAPHLTGGRVNDAAAIADREKRRGLEHPTLTAAFFGDPLPGRSALDKRRQLAGGAA
ncbi:hypothetical protein SAMN05216337_1017108 [Bradyrhizobium brasilense]|uniref:Myb-like domain-containing protein n=1 Tax=Bradyrhizobium brasilense TaxID=1419277 RepID=A0A1G6YVC8_9BRAD|nr:hypothetical protein [Bradyrhizobium brasilense]SDD94290.1 hypothetical protein SAMN05216337_1017108 [Bradyrhizobium brasilense]